MSGDVSIRPAAGPADRDAVLAFVEAMGFNPRDAATWDALGMSAVTAWQGGELVGAIPFEPRPLRVSEDAVAWSLHETTVAVRPERRSAGVGSAMQEKLLELLESHDSVRWARGEPVSMLSVYREEPESAAYRWYLKNGFQRAYTIHGWHLEGPAPAGPLVGYRVYSPADAKTPWAVMDEVWRVARRGQAGVVDRGRRPLREWLGVHPYRRRYRFEVLVREGEPAGYALLGVGRMHSPVERVDVLELLVTGDAAGLVRAIRQHAAGRPIRWAMAEGDPLSEVARAQGFEARAAV